MTLKFPYEVGDVIEVSNLKVTFNRWKDESPAGVVLSRGDRVLVVSYKVASRLYRNPETYDAVLLHRDMLIERPAPVICWLEWFDKVSQ